MSEQQEQSEEAGLLPSQDLEPSKEDDAHGHFRQVSSAQAQRRTHRLPDLIFFSLLLTRAPSASCARSWVPAPGRFCFHSKQLILLLLSQPRLILNNSSMHANKETANRDLFFFLHRNRIKTKQIRLAGWIRHREARFCGRASTKCVKSSSTRFAGWFLRRMFSLQTHYVCVSVCRGCYARSTGRRSVVILHGESVLGWDLAPEQSVGGTWTLCVQNRLFVAFYAVTLLIVHPTAIVL